MHDLPSGTGMPSETGLAITAAPIPPKKRFEGHSRSYPGVPLAEEGGDLLSRIAVQYHRRARA